MPDIDKVIYDIERCVCHVPDACRDCSHYQDDALDCMEKLLADALALLKQEESIPVSWLKEKLEGHPELPYAVTDGINNVLDLWEGR